MAGYNTMTAEQKKNVDAKRRGRLSVPCLLYDCIGGNHFVLWFATYRHDGESDYYPDEYGRSRHRDINHACEKYRSSTILLKHEFRLCQSFLLAVSMYHFQNNIPVFFTPFFPK